MFQSHEENSIGCEDINKTETVAGHFIFLVFILFGKGHNDGAADSLNVKRSITGGKLAIRECRRRERKRIEVFVENFDYAAVKIGGV